jgi:hypothetical protein
MRTWRRGYDGGSNTNKCFMIILVLLFQNALWTLSSHMLLVSLVRSIYGENKCIIMDSSRWQSRDEVEGAWQKHYRPWIISRRWTANIEMKEQRLQTWSSKKGSEHISYIYPICGQDEACQQGNYTLKKNIIMQSIEEEERTICAWWLMACEKTMEELSMEWIIIFQLFVNGLVIPPLNSTMLTNCA